MVAVVAEGANVLKRRESAIRSKLAEHPILPLVREREWAKDVLFRDGHVTHYWQEELLISEPAKQSEAPRYRMWNNDHLAPWDLHTGKGKAP